MLCFDLGGGPCTTTGPSSTTSAPWPVNRASRRRPLRTARRRSGRRLVSKAGDHVDLGLERRSPAGWRRRDVDDRLVLDRGPDEGKRCIGARGVDVGGVGVLGLGGAALRRAATTTGRPCRAPPVARPWPVRYRPVRRQRAALSIQRQGNEDVAAFQLGDLVVVGAEQRTPRWRRCPRRAVVTGQPHRGAAEVDRAAREASNAYVGLEGQRRVGVAVARAHDEVGPAQQRRRRGIVAANATLRLPAATYSHNALRSPSRGAAGAAAIRRRARRTRRRPRRSANRRRAVRAGERRREVGDPQPLHDRLTANRASAAGRAGGRGCAGRRGRSRPAADGCRAGR